MHLINRDTVHPLRSGEPLLTQPLKDSAALSDSSIRWGGLRFGGNLLVMLVLVLLMLPVAATAQTEVEGEVSGVWEVEGNPYIVLDSLIIPDGDTLFIEPGVIIRILEDREENIEVDSLIGIHVYGALIARGTEDDSIYFRSNHEEPRPKDWRGLIGYRDNAVIELEYVDIRHTARAIEISRSLNLSLNNCTISESNMVSQDIENVIVLTPNAIFCYHTPFLMSNCHVLNVLGWMIWVRYTDCEVSDCEFEDGERIVFSDCGVNLIGNEFLSGRFYVENPTAGCSVFENRTFGIITVSELDESLIDIHHNLIINTNIRDYIVDGIGLHIRGSANAYNNTVINFPIGVRFDPWRAEHPDARVINNLLAHNDVSIAAANEVPFIHDYNLRHSPFEQTIWLPREQLVFPSEHEIWCEPLIEDTVRYIMSSLSPSVDRGDPDMEYRQEPEPDGDRINIGLC